jgi:hypothetical protein
MSSRATGSSSSTSPTTFGTARPHLSGHPRLCGEERQQGRAADRHALQQDLPRSLQPAPLFLPEQQDIGIRPEVLACAKWVRPSSASSIPTHRQPHSAPLSAASIPTTGVRSCGSSWCVAHAASSSGTTPRRTTAHRPARFFITLQDGTRAYFPVRHPKSVKFRSDPEDKADPCARLFRDETSMSSTT